MGRWVRETLKVAERLWAREWGKQVRALEGPACGGFFRVGGQVDPGKRETPRKQREWGVG